MKHNLLRSIFVSGPTDPPDAFLENYRNLKWAAIVFQTEEDARIFKYVDEFVGLHGHVPNIATIRTSLEFNRDNSAIDRLEFLSSARPSTQGDFVVLLEEVAERARRDLLDRVIREAHTISQTGMSIRVGREEKTYSGSVDAVNHILAVAPTLLTPTMGSRISGEVLGDGSNFREEFEKAEADPTLSMGRFTGIKQFDDVFGGLRRGEMWIHSAYAGGLKTTFALNWFYNMAVYMGESSVYFALEMTYQHLRNIVLAMHSYHGKFKDVRCELGLQGETGPSTGVDYTRIKNAKVTPEERAFLFDHVLPDMERGIASGEYGAMFIEVADPNKRRYTMFDLKSAAEMAHGKRRIKQIFIDHASIVDPEETGLGTTDGLNRVIRDAKKLALNFNRKEGIPVLTLFQLNREGYANALKWVEKHPDYRDERGSTPYTLNNLSYANEAERSADIVTASWTDTALEKENRAMFMSLKARDSAKPTTFFTRVVWPYRRMLTCEDEAAFTMVRPEDASFSGISLG